MGEHISLTELRISRGLTIDCKPFVLILPFGKSHNLSKASPAERSFCILSQLITCCTFCGISRSELVPRPLVTIIVFM